MSMTGREEGEEVEGDGRLSSWPHWASTLLAFRAVASACPLEGAASVIGSGASVALLSVQKREGSG